jgi:hypothetical protein
MTIGRRRLGNQHISRPTFRDPTDVVGWLGAVQAQDYLGGLWAIGLRTKGATEATVEDAIARRQIVRTWPMRGTLHFVAAEDIRWILPVLTPRVVAGAQSRFRQLGLDDATFTKSARVAENALAGGTVVRRDRRGSERRRDRDTLTRGLHLLGVLSQQGLLCFGPRDGKQHTFTLLEEWLPSSRTLGRADALGELARRYFASHGPATVHDFAWWSGLTVTDARAGLEGVKSELESEDVDGRTFWFAIRLLCAPGRVLRTCFRHGMNSRLRTAIAGTSWPEVREARERWWRSSEPGDRRAGPRGRHVATDDQEGRGHGEADVVQGIGSRGSRSGGQGGGSICPLSRAVRRDPG